MKYGLLGYPLTHTMSPFIHKRLFDEENIGASYELFECEKLNDDCINALKKLDGFNITIPHKESIIQYLQSLDMGADEYRAVNTVDNKGKFKGHNTDVNGFLKSVERVGATLSGSVLILGAGGVARMAIVETAKRGGTLVVAVRRESFLRAEKLAKEVQSTYAQASICVMDIKNIKGEYDLLINCTPVGMYPNVDNCPVSESVIQKCKAVFDMIYNPSNTQLLQIAEKNNIPNIGGMYMLVTQAAIAHEIWNDKKITNEIIDNITKDANIFMKVNFQKCPIAFVGFMASGKTTLAKAFAKSMDMTFVDIDEEIVKREELSISEIFSQKGEVYFRARENEVLREFANKKCFVISTGGGAPMFKDNKEILAKDTITVFLDTPFDTCYKRIEEEKGRPLANGREKESIAELYEMRYKVYNEAHIVIDGTKDIAKQIKDLQKHFRA